MKIKPKKILTNVINNILLVLSFFCLIFAVVFFIVITKNSILIKDLSYLGFNEFQKIFSFPIRLLIGFTSLLAVHIAYKNLLATTQNIKFNNYFKHTELYIDTLIDYFEYFKLNIGDQGFSFNNQTSNYITIDEGVYNKLTKGFFRSLYGNWFNKIDQNVGKIKDDILITLLKYISFINKNKKEIINTNEHWFEINDFNKKLYLFKPVLKLYEDEIPLNNFRLKVIIAIIKTTLEFSDQLNDEVIEVYNSFCKPKP